MKKLLIVIAAAGFSTAAFAQAATDLASVDTDRSGEVSYAEALVVWTDLTAEAFAKADADQSSGLNAAELSTLATAN